MVENNQKEFTKANYQQIIWDWNGTILDDTELVVEAINATLLEKDKNPIDVAYMRDHIGFPVSHFYTQLGIGETEEEFKWINTFYHQQYDPHVARVKPYSEIKGILDTAKSLGVVQNILSARGQVSLEVDVKFFGLYDYFTKIKGPVFEKSYLGKLDLAHQLVDPELSSVMIGDTVHDAEIAESLGIDCILIAKGINSKERLAETQAKVLDSHAELAKHLFRI